ncbi:MAG: hypothetical protein D6687_00745 [Acidobacteria bacterium]|nr:MAG: hypothetical protein D6687_00745 [Acidobacteriota bacterium]
MMKNFLYIVFLCLALLATNCSKNKTTADSPTEAYQMLYRAVKAKDIEAIKNMCTQSTHKLAEFQAQLHKRPLEEVFKNGFTETTYASSMPKIRDERINGDFGAVEVWNEKRRIWEDLPFIREATVSFEFIGDDKAKILEVTKSIPEMEIKEENNKVSGTKKGVTLSEAEEIKAKLTEAGANAKIENVGWRLAVGDVFRGTYKSPGKSQSQLEREAANLAIEQQPVANIDTTNVNVNTNVPQPPKPSKTTKKEGK